MRSFVILCLCLLTFAAACSAQKQLRVEDLVGDWQGESKCQGSNQYCKDETALYHFSDIEDQPTKVHLVADKLVNGKWEFMGQFDLDIDAASSTLKTEFPIPRTGGKGVLTFKVAGDKIDGIMMIYPENEIGRKIHVERKK